MLVLIYTYCSSVTLLCSAVALLGDSSLFVLLWLFFSDSFVMVAELLALTTLSFCVTGRSASTLRSRLSIILVYILSTEVSSQIVLDQCSRPTGAKPLIS